MKKVLLAAFLFTCSYSFSQTDFRFADSTAQWNVLDYSGLYPFPTTTNIYRVGSDTILSGKNYQTIAPFYFRRDSLNRIYTPDYLIYDFGKNANDSILHIGNQDAFCFVDSVDSVLIGHYRKRMFIRYGIDYNHLSYSDVWIDGIGSIYNNPIYGEYIYVIPEQSFDTLLCFFENGQLLYHFSSYATCDVNTGISEIPQSVIHIFPNPATTYLTIQSSENFSANTIFQLFDITGRMILQKQLNIQTTQIELNTLSKGMYLYNVVSDKERLGAGKLVIE